MKLTFLQLMAVAIATGGAEDPELVWRKLESSGKGDLWLAKARQVLGAIRIPSEPMIEAHFEAHAEAGTIFADVRDMWAKMVDRAVAEDAAPARVRGGEHQIGGVLR